MPWCILRGVSYGFNRGKASWRKGNVWRLWDRSLGLDYKSPFSTNSSKATAPSSLANSLLPSQWRLQHLLPVPHYRGTLPKSAQFRPCLIFESSVYTPGGPSLATWAWNVSQGPLSKKVLANNLAQRKLLIVSPSQIYSCILSVP